MVTRKQTSRRKAITAGSPLSDKGKPGTINVDKLEQDRVAHIAELGRLRESLREIPETSIEEGDPTAFERENALALIHQVEDHIAEIDRALQAARRGSYGICEHCGQPIDAERLRILPETRVCVKCKVLQEKHAHHRAW